MRRTTILAALLGVALGTSACAGRTSKETSPFAPAPDPNERPPEAVVDAAKPWTPNFLAPAVLIADEVRIEGPAPLLEHVVTRPEPEYHEVKQKTTPEGLVQTITQRPGAGDAPVEIRAQLDNLAITAMRRIVVLEKPGRGDVVVIANGSVWWRGMKTGEEKRGETLKFVGPIQR